MPKAQQKQQTIEEILNSLNPTQKENTQNLRALIRNTVPETVEMVKQGKIVYKLADRDFVWLSHTQTHIDLFFSMGASLASPLLTSRGTAEASENVRLVEVSNLAKHKQEITRLLKDAANLPFKHCAT